MWATVYTAADGNALMNYVNGTNATLVNGDIIELTSNSEYNKRFGIPNANITIRAAAGYSPVINTQLYWNNDVAAAGGGITFENVKININNRFISIRDKDLDIETITFRNCEITNLANQLIYGGNASKTINSIVLDKCVIHDCTSGRLIETTHAVNSITVTNCTIYKGANSFFYNNTDRTSNIAFTFTNNTVYDWGTNHMFHLDKDYGSGSTYVITDNIFNWSSGIAKWIITMDGTNTPSGTITSQKNLIQGIYGKTENDYNLSNLDITGSSVPFASTTAGSEDFTLDMTTYPKLQSKATAADADHAGVLGDPRWAKFTLNQTTDYTPVNANGVKVALPRSIAKDNWSTIVLPFDIASDDITTIFGAGASVAELESGDASTLTFSTTLTGSKMKANQPYAIKVASDFTSATINGVDIKVPASTPPTQTVGDWKFVGTYASTTVPEGSYYFKSNKLYQKGASGTTTMKPFRAYLTYTGGSPAPALNFVIDGETTGIAHINADGQMNLEEGAVYNLNGQRVANPTKGLYIVNGKKTIIK